MSPGDAGRPLRVCAVVTDLMFSARVVDAAERAGASLQLLGDPANLPPPADVDLVFVDWAARGQSWGDALRRWRDAAARGSAPQLVLFGSHTDVAAHREAKAHGIGPVMARSAFVQRVPELVRRRV